MSHFTRIRTKLKDVEVVKKVLRDMGYEPVEDPEGGQVIVRGWAGDTRKADMKVARGEFDIGFVCSADGFELIGDFTGMQLSEKRFADDLGRRYAREVVRAGAEAQGFAVVEEVQQADGSVRLVVERWT
jgi:hypothetical protein